MGTEMHAWYELLKGLVLFDVGMYNKECIDPVFNEIFIEGLQRAYAGEPIAIEYMRSHWGMCSGAPEPPPPSQG